MLPIEATSGVLFCAIFMRPFGRSEDLDVRSGNDFSIVGRGITPDEPVIVGFGERSRVKGVTGPCSLGK